VFDIMALLRIGLQGLSLFLGSLGIFFLYWSCMGVPIAGHAMVFLGTATAIVLAVNNDNRQRR
jgi:hypothetical protein